MLEARGEAIRDGDTTLKDTINIEMNYYVHENKEQLQSPKEAYVIFEHPEGLEWVIK